jgi:hypothetical protein
VGPEGIDPKGQQKQQWGPNVSDDSGRPGRDSGLSPR